MQPPGAEPAVASLVARLFEAHHAALYRHLIRLTGDPDRAADAAQEAFVRALSPGALPGAAAAPSGSPPAAVLAPRPAPPPHAALGGSQAALHDPQRAWLFRVATRAALDEASTAARRRRLLNATPARAPLGDAPGDAHAALEARERHERVAAALAVLPPRDRAALLLREAGFAHREIAEVLRTTPGSVGTVLARAVTRLAAELRASVPGGPEAL